MGMVPEKKKKIRVLFINHTAKLGGGELALSALIHHIDKDKVTHEVLLCEDGPLSGRLIDATDVHIMPLSAEIREARKDTLGAGGWTQLKTLGGLPTDILPLSHEIRHRK